MIVDEQDYLAHYGILRRSGRYPWGSSSSANVRNRTFLEWIRDLRGKGLSDTQICDTFSGEDRFTTSQLRAAQTIAISQQKQHNINRAQKYKDRHMSNVAIGKKMGLNESSVRALLAPGAADKARVLLATADMLRDNVEKHGMLDVGRGTEATAGVSKEKYQAAISILEEEGYKVHYPRVPQVGTGKETSMKVMAKEGISYSEVASAVKNDEVRIVDNFSNDRGRTFLGIHTPIGVDPGRLAVRYAEDGGAEADGVIYVRPGAEGLSMGEARYAQVRIQVGKGQYLKGMAMYKDDLPDGVDLEFNTNKDDTGNKLDALKPLQKDVNGKIDKGNPFGAQISKQIIEVDAKGKEKLVSAINIVNEEGNWNEWSKNLSTQMLSKQSPVLARQQLKEAFEAREQEYEAIMSMTNPTVRKKLLAEFSDGTEAAAVHMKAASMPRQRTQVILPVSSMRDNEVYAPNFKDGETVVLVRYPHGGIFEVPELTVNNRQPQAKGLLGNAKDAIAINAKTASQMSGADFDGDTVLVIPNNQGKVKRSQPLDALKGFDPQRAFPEYPGMKPISKAHMQIEMGKVSNLITDMSIQKAPPSEIARAVRHSMVVIDSEKHTLDYRGSEQANGIKQLREKYQPEGGASTLISRATSETRVRKTKPRPAAEGGPVDKATGKKVFVPDGDSYIDRKGNVAFPKQKVERLANTQDAATLSSGTPIEREYVKHSNNTRALSDKARKSWVETPNAVYSPAAYKTYRPEVDRLNAALQVALRNAPRERQAQQLANSIIDATMDANPNMDKAQEKRIRSQALDHARATVGAKKVKITISDAEWQAIQAGAVTHTKLDKILTNADMDRVRELATPRPKLLMTSAKTNQARTMLASGNFTRAEVAARLGVSLTTLDTGVA